MEYLNLFSKGKLNRTTTKNRIVMSPMGEDMADADGSVSDQMIAYYAARARGGTAVIIPGVASVEYPRGKTETCQARLDQEKYIKDFSRLAAAIHRYGALLIPQLHHAGAATDLKTTEGVLPVSLMESTESTDNTGAHVSSTETVKVPTHVLTTEEIRDLENKFIQAAVNAKLANCDGVELHGAHSYLICQFLTPYINLRTDEYGGSLENRARFPLNIIKGIRKACGPDFIIGIRMPVHRWASDGFTDEESIELAKMLEKAGCDFLDVSGGIPPRPTCLIESEAYDQGYRVDLSEKVKPHVNIPVFALGNIKEPSVCEEILSKGSADFVVLGRALIADPDFAEKARYGKGTEIRKCISCSKGCYGELSQYRFITCALNPEAGFEWMTEHLLPSKKTKKVVIVGGGIAGMQAAITATGRGHRAIILEKTNKLGGQIDLACAGPHKSRIRWVYDWFAGEIDRLGIEVHYEVEATAEIVKSFKPDAVFVAAGSIPAKPPIPGLEFAVDAWDVLLGNVQMPENKNAVVLGGGIVGCELTELLAEKGNKTVMIEMLPLIAEALEPFHRIDVLSDLGGNPLVEVLTESVVKNITGSEVTYEKEGQKHQVSGDFIVAAFGQKPIGENLTDQLNESDIPAILIGDSKRPGNFLTATRTAYDAAINL